MADWFDGQDAASPPPAGGNGPGGLQGQQAQITNLYQLYLHRTPSQDEINSHLQNPGGIPAVEALIKDSPEAKSYPPPPMAPPAATPSSPVYAIPTAADAKGYSLGNYTYAGFEPTSLTRHVDTTDVTAGGKDFVQRYLVNNQIDPNSKTWASDAAASLNKQYNTTVFTAIDGETLGYGDEYVHSAPNGYGLQSGQFDPSAKGQFFWGSTTPRSGPAVSGAPPATGSPTFVQGQTYTQGQIPGLTQVDPGLFSDKSGRYFDNQGTYRGNDTAWFYGGGSGTGATPAVKGPTMATVARTEASRLPRSMDPSPVAPTGTMADLINPPTNYNFTPALTAPTGLPQQFAKRMNTMSSVM